MKFTNEQLKKAKAAKSADELLALAKENGVELTEEEAAKYFAELHKEGELVDDELSNVSGGCGDDKPEYSSSQSPKYWVNQTLYSGSGIVGTYKITKIIGYIDDDHGYEYELARELSGTLRDPRTESELNLDQKYRTYK